MSTEISVQISLPKSVSRELDSIVADHVNILDFGALCDGIADDTMAIQAALNAVGSWTSVGIGIGVDEIAGSTGNATNLSQGTIEFPAGRTVRITAVLDCPPGVTVDLRGSNLVQATAGAHAIQCLARVPNVGQGPFTGIANNVIRNGLFTGAGMYLSTGYGILMGGCGGFLLENVVVSGFYVNIMLWTSQYGCLRNVYSVGGYFAGVFTNFPTNLSNGGTLPCIDIKIDNCRFAKSVYGLWLRVTANIRLSQVDMNFCSRCSLVMGSPLPDYMSTTLTYTPGAGYQQGVYPLTIKDKVGTGFLGYAVVGSGGSVTGAYVTDGIGTGIGISSSPQILLIGAGTPTTAATFTPTFVREATNLAGLVGDAPSKPSSPTCGPIQFSNFKAEVGVTPPDSGYVVYASSVATCSFFGFNISSYNRGVASVSSPSSNGYYRWLLNSGNVSIYEPEFDGNDSTLSNPGTTSSDLGLVRNQGILYMPPNGLVTDYWQFVIDSTGTRVYNPAIPLLDVQAISSTQTVTAAFVPCIFNVVNRDNAQGFTMGNGYYTIPKTGYYLCKCDLRLADGLQGGVSYALGMLGHEEFYVTTSVTEGIARNGASRTDILHFNQGQQTYMSIFADNGGSKFAINTAALVVAFLQP